MFHDVQIDTSWSFSYFFKFAWKFKFSPVSSKIFSVKSQSKRFWIFLTFFKIFIFSQKMSHDVQKWPQFNIVPDFSWVYRYDFWILQILWCRNLAVSTKSLDEISQKSQKKSQKVHDLKITRRAKKHHPRRITLRTPKESSTSHLKNYTTSKSQEGPRSTTRAELLYELQRRALRVILRSWTFWDFLCDFWEISSKVFAQTGWFLYHKNWRIQKS